MYRKNFSSTSYQYSSSEEWSVFLSQASSEQETNEKRVEKSPPSSSPKSETGHRRSKVSEKGEKIKQDLDKIMDEIDDVLEENAEEFIKSYVQRGGE
ncbi:ubiquitin-like protein Pup [bacterium]|nr:ubiquitin-like protein Pup [candidate division CSSED10-310 bacterium]